MAVPNAELLALAKSLTIPVPWNRDQFVEHVAAARGRAITLIPTHTSALADSPCGLWLARDDEDLILHENGTSDYHIDQIVCHEIGHMLLDHGLDRAQDVVAAHHRRICERVLPHIDPATVRAVLGRTMYADDDERDAEMFANMVLIAAAEADEHRSMIRSAFLRRQ